MAQGSWSVATLIYRKALVEDKKNKTRFFILSDHNASSITSDLDPISTKDSFKFLCTEWKVTFNGMYNWMTLIASSWISSVLLDVSLALHFSEKSWIPANVEVSLCTDHRSSSVGIRSSFLNLSIGSFNTSFSDSQRVWAEHSRLARHVLPHATHLPPLVPLLPGKPWV